MFDCCGSGSVCCSRLRPEAHQKQPQKQPFPLRGEVGGGGPFPHSSGCSPVPALAARIFREGHGKANSSRYSKLAELLWDDSIHLQLSLALRE